MIQVNLKNACLAELLGTFILVFFGLGAVHAAVLTDAQTGIWQVAIVWGIAIALAIYTAGAVSGAHINPAITIAFLLFRKFPPGKVPAYIASQLLGAFLAAATLHVIFGGLINEFETAHQVQRGQAGSERSAMLYGCYFPNPAVAQQKNWPSDVLSAPQAFAAEAVGTAFLGLFVFALTDPRNPGGSGRHLAPLFIGLTVSIIISVAGPLTQAGLNPARDFGPRLFTYLAGWGSIAIPGPRNDFFAVYILAPILGAILGAMIYHYLIRPGLSPKATLTSV